ncbi:MAG TPA: TrkA family potassium uptake protein [Armatimonadota bacterium]|jgi:trk system potassium uptake protein TrkA
MYVIVIGGGKVGYYLTKTLARENHEVLLLEKDPRRAGEIRETLGDLVVLGDGCEVRTQEEAGMERADVVAAVTGDDEDNLVIAQIAKHRFQVPRSVARINNPKNQEVFKALGIDTTVSATEIIYHMIEQQIPSGDLIPLALLKNSSIEIVEVELASRSPVIGQSLKQIDLPGDTLVIGILRDGNPSLPDADAPFRTGDTIIALVSAVNEPALQELLHPEMV